MTPVLLALLAIQSNLTLNVQSTSAEGTWSCLVDLWIDTKVERGTGKADRVTVTVHEPHARMEAAPSSPAAFAATIAAESPQQQAAIGQLDGKSVTFTVDRKTGAIVGGGAAARFPVDVRFAGVDAAYWFALAWIAPLSPLPPTANARRTVERASAWGAPWKLAGDATVHAGSSFVTTGTLAGELTVGRGEAAIQRKLTITIAPRP